MDLRHLSAEWDPDGDSRQRPLDPKLVQDLLESFKGVILRSEAQHRLYVSMSVDDFEASLDHTDELLGLGEAENNSRARICVQDPVHENIEKMPILMVHPDDDGDDEEGASLPARLEAGQHRRKAMLDLARQVLLQRKEKAPRKMAMADKNAKVALDALKVCVSR